MQDEQPPAPGETEGYDETAYRAGFSVGYATGYEDATLTFSRADLVVLGVGFLALAIPLGILLAKAERPKWKTPWS